MKKLLILVLIAALMIAFIAAPAQAATSGETTEKAEILKSLGLFLGTNKGFELDRAPTRLEALIILIRLIGAEEEALNCWTPNPFDDKRPWLEAENYISYAYSTGLTLGMSANHFGISELSTAQHYITFVLRSLGYDEQAGDFSYEQALAKAEQIGLILPGAYADGKWFYRSDCVDIAYAALFCQMKDDGQSLFAYLAEQGIVPADADLTLHGNYPNIPEPIAPQEYVERTRVPILMYHQVLDYSGPNESLYLAPHLFQQHLDYFAENNITPITMQQLYEHWYNKAPLPEKPIVLTFDDGYTAMYREVFPRLMAKGFVATFFVFNNFIGHANGLTEDMVREMSAAGMEFGSHTVSHKELTYLSRDSMITEMSLSKAYFESLTGKPINFISYPVGLNNATVREVAQQYYLGAVSTEYGTASTSSNFFRLPRIRILNGETADSLKSRLSGLGY